MTLQEIKKTNKDILRASDVADLLESDPQDIRDQAHRDPSKLGFPVIVTGSRVKIPREGFLYFMRYGYAKGGTP
ncbi:hypothetical protein [Christensenella hongkongensis]|uniref:hypothetical protein n=1 Tax=Christensenella hongkongensis TaxID=270498 RepID=UPI00062378EC|nr:hypothetical protein [Christensenella hongkongensis]TCW30388.1 hypothetical protein EV208_1028 [Christensenella hongkongensis]